MTKNWIGIRTTLSFEQVKKVETDLGIHLPDDYCKTIGKINGGALKNAFYTDNVLGEIPFSRNVNLDVKAKNNIQQLFGILNDSEKRLFPFGRTGNGDYFCFQLQNNNYVVFYDHETESIHPICSSYTEFMNLLEQK